MLSPEFLEQMINPIGRALTPQAAAELLEVRADEQLQQRIDELADKCSEGTLTADERGDYEQIIAWFNLLTILQARSRSILQGNGDT